MSALVRYDAACRAIAECKAVDEVKSWADKAAAMQAYGRIAKDKTQEVDAAGNRSVPPTSRWPLSGQLPSSMERKLLIR